LFAEALRASLEGRGLEVVGVARGSEAIVQVHAQSPDVVLVDMEGTNGEGPALASEILAAVSNVRLIAIADPARTSEVIAYGFHGWVTRETPLSDVAASILAVGEGATSAPSAGNGNGHGNGHRNGHGNGVPRLVHELTERERQVLLLLVEGCSGDELATRLSVSANTVRTHVRNVLTKLHVRSRLEAATLAVHTGIVTPGERLS
jgi:DNA-binding NarL/FixJ family response regulator